MTDELDAPAEVARDQKGRFLAGGASPNPLGRTIATYPRDSAELRDLARQYTPEAVAELVKIFRTARSKRVRLIAIGMLLDRGYGRAVEMQVIAQETVRPYEGTELARRIAFCLDPRFAHEQGPAEPLRVDYDELSSDAPTSGPAVSVAPKPDEL
jgi:hypothetical protein